MSAGWLLEYRTRSQLTSSDLTSPGEESKGAGRGKLRSGCGLVPCRTGRIRQGRRWTGLHLFSQRDDVSLCNPFRPFARGSREVAEAATQALLTSPTAVSSR